MDRGLAIFPLQLGTVKANLIYNIGMYISIKNIILMIMINLFQYQILGMQRL